MTAHGSAAIWAALDATWAAAATETAGGFCIRKGAGGGKRVSAASLLGDAAPGIDAAEAAMARLGQPALFVIRGAEAALDAALADRGYAVVDPVVLYSAPVGRLAAEPPPVTVFTLWEPLAIQRDLWRDGGIGPARLAVMERACAPKTSLLGRVRNRPAGTGFVACHGQIAMVHALEIAPPFRRLGLGRWMMQGAARWAETQGAAHLALAVTRANFAAIGLYASMGMEIVEQYHYRMRG